MSEHARTDDANALREEVVKIKEELAWAKAELVVTREAFRHAQHGLDDARSVCRGVAASLANVVRLIETTDGLVYAAITALRKVGGDK